MAKWQRKLYVGDVWKAAQDGEITIQSLSKIVATRLRKMHSMSDADLEERRIELAEWFEDLADDQNATSDDFDSLWNELYDWGDTALDDHWNGKKVCWIDTIEKPNSAMDVLSELTP